MSAILLLSGPPGAGKTTVSRELISSSPGPTVCIEGDRFWPIFAKDATPFAKDATPVAKDATSVKLKSRRFRTLLWSIVASAMPCAHAGYETIVDFSIPYWFLDPLRARFPDMPFDYVVLRPPLSVCAARAATRAEGVIADYTDFQSFYADFDAPRPHLIEDHSNDPIAIAALIRQGLAEDRFRLPPVL